MKSSGSQPDAYRPKPLATGDKFMNKCLSILLMASVTLWASQAMAQNAAATAPKAAKASTAKKAPPKNEAAAVQDDDPEPDTGASAASELQCELGNKVTVYHNEGDDQHIALRWLKRVHRLTRVGTSTGAHRYENPKSGLVWIGIPGKSMLLDSKKGRQLANECRSAEQLEMKKPMTMDTLKGPASIKG
jgi:hypothetical protein